MIFLLCVFHFAFYLHYSPIQLELDKRKKNQRIFFHLTFIFSSTRWCCTCDWEKKSSVCVCGCVGENENGKRKKGETLTQNRMFLSLKTVFSFPSVLSLFVSSVAYILFSFNFFFSKSNFILFRLFLILRTTTFLKLVNLIFSYITQIFS